MLMSEATGDSPNGRAQRAFDHEALLTAAPTVVNVLLAF